MKKIIMFKFIFMLIFMFCYGMESEKQATIGVDSQYSKKTRKKDAKAVISNIRQKKPNIVIFTTSKDGKLSERSLKFYVENVLVPLRQKNNGDYTCFFYDLASWNYSKWNNPENFRKQYCYDKELLNALTEANFSVSMIYSKNFFIWLKENSSSKVLENILSQKIPWEASSEKIDRYLKSSLTVEATKLKDLSFMKEYLKAPVSSIYSALQYIEAIYLIETIAKYSNAISDEIIFLLPNDEINYYLGTEKNNWAKNIIPFKKNIVNFFNENKLSQNKTINVYLIPFLYREKNKSNSYMCTRPYVFRETDSSIKGYSRDIEVGPETVRLIISGKKL